MRRMSACTHQTTTPRTAIEAFQNLCAFAPWRLCAKSLRHRYGSDAPLEARSFDCPCFLFGAHSPIKQQLGSHQFKTVHLRRHLLPLGLLAVILVSTSAPAKSLTDIQLDQFHPLLVPKTTRLLLKSNDRLAICGDSITEQKMYSRIIEDYLTVCVPELKVSVRQYGWSGEKAPGFLARMTNDCLRFQPTIATTCYGMNDFEYRPYAERIGQTYQQNSTAIVEAFKTHGARVILGSPGCVGKVPPWARATNDTVENLNLSLCRLRNMDIEIARREKVGFADVFWPMLTDGIAAQENYGVNYGIAGADGVHPHWAGHTVMAYAFLKAMGLNGEIGTFTVNLRTGHLKVSPGHEVISAKDGSFVVKSRRYPLCPCLESGQAAASYPVCGQDYLQDDNSIRSGMALVPFNRDLNRLMLVAKHGQAACYLVTWGNQGKVYTAEQLAQGINLAGEFPCNPFCEAFAMVDAAVAAKQAYETKQIKELFRSPEAARNMDAVVAGSEKERERLVAAIQAAFVPVTHTIKIVPQ